MVFVSRCTRVKSIHNRTNVDRRTKHVERTVSAAVATERIFTYSPKKLKLNNTRTTNKIWYAN